MIDKNKLLDGLKECYDEYDGMDTFYDGILWNIAKGNWDVEEEIVCTEEKEEPRTTKSCYNCDIMKLKSGCISCDLIKDGARVSDGFARINCKHWKQKEYR